MTKRKEPRLLRRSDGGCYVGVSDAGPPHLSASHPPAGGRSSAPVRRTIARGIRLLATVPAIVGFVLLGSGTAFAGGIAFSSDYYYTVQFTYYNYSYIDTATGYPAQAATVTVVDGSSDAPAGWMGAYPMMFYSNGSLCRAGSWEYNGASQNSFGAIVSPGCGAGPAYYSQGYTAAWNGSSYNVYATYASPDQNS